MDAPFHLHLERAHCRALLAVLGPEAVADNAREQLSRVEAQLAVAPEGRMAVLAKRLGLTALQCDFVWTAIALACEPRLVAHGQALDGQAARRGLSVALYCRLAKLSDEDARAVALWLAAENPLVECGLLSIADANWVAAATPFAASPHLAKYLAGESHADPLVTRLLAPEFELVDDEEQRSALAELVRVLRDETAALVIVEGPRGSGRRTALARATAGCASAVRARFDSVAHLETLIRAVRRETVLHGTIPVLADFAVSGEPSNKPAIRARLEAAIQATPGPFAITTSEWNLDLELDRPTVRVRWPVADIGVRRQQWPRVAARLGVAIEGDLDQLAFQYRIGPGGMERALRSRMIGLTTGELSTTEVVTGIRHNISERLGGLARRVEPRQAWDDLVLPDDTLDQVRSLIARVRHSFLVLESWGYRTKLALGQGVAAMFSGPPGTGKTMVAGLIARTLGLDLYQVDLSQIVSKWIGETEKQLARVFEAAEEGHALLLFDEADALFGRRSADLKGATDRYANLEVNYLLQRIESFSGLTILTTNLDQSIDRALMRRLAAHIKFASPDEDERERLWRTLVTANGAPIARNLDFVDLSRAFPTMAGGNIRNAAVSAAFLAASDGTPTITHDHLVRAARAEYRSMGHVLADRPLAHH